MMIYFQVLMIYIYIYVCVCVCVLPLRQRDSPIMRYCEKKARAFKGSDYNC